MRYIKISLAAAVCAVLLGAGGATASSLIGSAQIKDNSVQSRDVKNGTLKTDDMSAAARAALKGNTGPAGPTGLSGPMGPAGKPGMDGATGSTGPIGPKGDTGSPGMSGVVYVYSGPGSGAATALCPAGKYAIAGGGQALGAGTDGWLWYSGMYGNGLGWSAQAHDVVDGSDVYAYAVCAKLDAAPTWQSGN